MTKRLATLFATGVFLLANLHCASNKKDKVYKGRLAIAGLCMNYTIQLVEGEMNPALIDTAWTDESSGKKYNRVFALKNPCQFPSSIQEGQVFSFVLDTTAQPPCARCRAFYPTPTKSVAITIVKD
ncbi:MAG: hypothetical protein RIR12_2029 [Bacteroidota bacterium]|jgi:hypothetical protein